MELKFKHSPEIKNYIDSIIEDAGIREKLLNYIEITWEAGFDGGHDKGYIEGYKDGYNEGLDEGFLSR